MALELGYFDMDFSKLLRRLGAEGSGVPQEDVTPEKLDSSPWRGIDCTYVRFCPHHTVLRNKWFPPHAGRAATVEMSGA